MIGVAPPLALLAVVAALAVAAAVFLDASSVPWARQLPPAVRTFFGVVTDIGRSHWYLVPLGVVLSVLLAADWSKVDGRLRRAWWAFGAITAYAFAAIAGSGILVNVAKFVVGRFRPLYFDSQGWLTLDPLTFGYANASFPSGHSTTVGALLVIGILLMPRLAVAWVVVAIVLCLSRVAVSAHFPSDVVVGFSLGAAFAYALARLMAARRIAFRYAADGRLRLRGSAFSRVWRRRDGRHSLFAALVATRVRWTAPARP